MSKHTILIEQTVTNIRRVEVETSAKHPTLKSLREHIVAGVNNVGFDQVGVHHSCDYASETVDGIDMDYVGED